MTVYEFIAMVLPGIGVLSVIMTLDIISGIVRASVKREIMSRKLLYGVTIKSGILVVVGLAFAVDLLIVRFMPEAKQYIPLYLGKLVGLWYMLGEVLSILENLYRLGVPMPKFLVRSLAVTRSHISSTVKVPNVNIENVNVGGEMTRKEEASAGYDELKKDHEKKND